MELILTKSYLVSDLVFESLKVVRPPSKGMEVLAKRFLTELSKNLEETLYSEIAYVLDIYP